jgi:hypothetical protein
MDDRSLTAAPGGAHSAPLPSPTHMAPVDPEACAAVKDDRAAPASETSRDGPTPGGDIAGMAARSGVDRTGGKERYWNTLPGSNARFMQASDAS